MILTALCGLLALGWTVNTAVFQSRGNLRMSLLNGVLAAAAMTAYMWRVA